MAKKEVSPIDIVLEVFVNQLGKSSAVQYKQVKNAFGIEEAFVFATSAQRNFLELLPKLLVSDKKKTINSIVEGLRDNVLESYKWNRNGLKSYKTYLKTFLDFVGRLFDDSRKYDEIVEKLKNSGLNLVIDELDEEMLSSNDNGIYKYSTLITTFKTRLNRQERTSGDKVWLPLSFINKIFSVNGRKDYLDWIKDLVNDIHIHYYDENRVKDVTIKDGGINIKLVKSSDMSDMYSVWLMLEKNGEIKAYRVLTPTGRGNNKKRLSIKNSKTLGEIEIDHVKPIDRTLKEKGDSGELEQLQKVTEEFKKLKNQGLEKSVTELSNAARNIKIDLNALKDELDLIRRDSPLRLMAKKYNSQKSNGSSFKEYRKTMNNKYIGIIEEGIKMANDEEAKDMTLYQELTNVLEESITIDYSDSGALKGEPVKVTELDINII